MGIKLATALLAGSFFMFFLDFFFILGLFLNYIQALDINVYYNVLFADHQSYLVFFTGVFIFGYLFIYFPSTQIATIIFGVCFAITCLMLIPSIGFSIGQMMFEKTDQVLHEKQYTYQGKIVYEGRSTIWFFDDDEDTIIEINIKDLNE